MVGRKKVILKIKDAANHWNISQAAIRATWLGRNGFPGKSGYYPIEEINRWLVERAKNQTQGPLSKAAVVAANELGVELVRKQESTVTTETISQIKIDRQKYARRLDELKIAEKEGRLVDRELVKQEILRHHALAFQFLSQIPNLVSSVLPPDIPQEVRHDFMRRAESLIRSGIDSFLDAIRNIDDQKG